MDCCTSMKKWGFTRAETDYLYWTESALAVARWSESAADEYQKFALAYAMRGSFTAEELTAMYKAGRFY